MLPSGSDWVRRTNLLKLERVGALLCLAAPLFAQYAGPAILSRGEAPAAMAAPEIRFRPFVEVSGVYDTGLAGVQVTDQGDLANNSSIGLGLAWGVSGTHNWRHTRLGLDYRGAVNHYVHRTFYDSIEQSMMLGVMHQFTRHVALNVNAAAGQFSRDFGLQGLRQTVPFDPSQTFVPATDFFDNRTIYLTTQADVVYQRSARLSFDGGAGGFINRRRSTALYGVIGATAHGDVQYRLSRQNTIGLNYEYEHFDFTRVFGGSDVHVFSGSFARGITRLVEFTGFAGMARVESSFLEAVPIDPTIATLLGISSATQVRHDIRWAPQYGARLSRTFRTGVAYIAAGQSVTPGNGLFLTSIATTVFAGYGYTGLRRWSLNAGMGYTRAKSIGNVLGVYTSLDGGFSASRQLVHGINFVMSYDARYYDSPDFKKYNRWVQSARVGLGWSPGDVPLRIW